MTRSGDGRRAWRSFLHTVILSEARDLLLATSRSLASLRMTIALLPPRRFRRGRRMVAQLRQVVRVVQAAVQHDPLDRLAVLDVVERVCVEHEKIGELSSL